MKFFRRSPGRRALEAEMREEMKFHLDSRIETLIAQGMAPAEAARTARIEFGSAAAHREDCLAAVGYRPWDELRADFRFAARGIRKQPGYTATAIAILAVAIGVNSAFFTLFSHHVLKPLAIRGADRHFDMFGLDRHRERTGGWSAEEIRTLRDAARQQVEDFYTERTIQILVLEPVQRLGLVSMVSGNYFQLLGGTAAIGRTWNEVEQREPVIVLSASGRRRHFQDDASPLGRKLRVRSTFFTVIGVMPLEFTGTVSAVPDFWVPVGMQSAIHDREADREPRYNLSGLLAPGSSLSQAEAALTAATTRLPGRTSDAVARVQLKLRSATIVADEELRIVAALVFGAFLTVLVIACANLANLCLSRAASRTHEIAMRLSLGASRGRLVRQLLTESTFIALLGAAAGMVLGAVAVQQAQSRVADFAGAMGVAMLPMGMDWRVFLYSAILGIAAGLAFGLLPAVEVTSPSLALSAKRENSAFAGRVRPRRLRNVLLTGQVASSLVLLIFAGIFVRHLQGLDRSSPSYDLDRIYDLRLDRPQPALLATLEQQPAVASISAVERVPLYGEMEYQDATAGGRRVGLMYNYVDHRYFETMAMPIEGRGFNAREAAANARVVVVSRAAAQAFWPGAAPLGQSIKIDQPGAEGTYEVIGVAPDVISGWLFRGKDSTAVYFPAAAGQTRIQSAMVRFNGNPTAAIAAIRKLCAAVRDASGCEPVSLREVSAMQRFPFAGAAAVAGSLGVLALVLTAVGLYSVIRYSVVQRRREIGVYLALGASPRRVIRRIVGEAWRCVAVGMAIGLPVCVILSRLMRSSVFGIPAFDAGTYSAVPALLAVIATLACVLPARRAAQVDPMELLKEE